VDELNRPSEIGLKITSNDLLTGDRDRSFKLGACTQSPLRAIAKHLAWRSISRLQLNGLDPRKET
jgi:hypothetical protein